jgi:phosphatidylglycerol:prolipoprotein diacylglycerol transferase
MTLYPLVFQLGPLTITGYGLMMMVAFLLAGWAMQHELRRRHMNEEYSADIVVAAVIGGIVGAKLWYVALTRDPAALFSRGGLVWYGGFLGGVGAVILNGWRRKVPLRLTMDIASPALALGYALGRVGCFLVQDDYGLPTTLPWGMKFPKGLPPTTAANMQQMFGATLPANTPPWEVVSVHPTQLYETTLMLLAFWVMWRLRAHRHALGWPFGLYLVLAGVERFLIEFLRAKDDRLLSGFTIAQATSVGIVLAGAAVLARFWTPDNFRIPSDSGVLLHPAEAAPQKKTAE